ncbi:MAG TPA: tetratricopeptide repeat protein [Gammaproteobacteria bacterium]|nr:tetratricopeptide repeat protein [Gammaproteobacteria bacterium]
MRFRIPQALATALSVLIAGGAVTLPAGEALAQQPPPREETRQVQALRERVFQALAKAQEFMEAKDYRSARRELDQVRAIEDLNSYERGQILYFTGLVEYQQDNLAAAVRIFEQVVAIPDLPSGFRADTMWALVQLAMSAEQYRKVLEYGNQWLREAENPSGDPFYLLAVAHYQLKEYRKTVEMMDRAIEIAERDGKYAREDWYGLLRATLHELGETRRLRSLLETLVARWPKKDYWIHLSTVYSELKEERKQLAALETIYEAGWMERENEILQLAQLYMQRGGAYKGARLLEKGMESGIIERDLRNYRLLAQAWMQAQDDRRSIPPLREAASRSDDGLLHLQLAQSYLNLYEYEDCVESARAALNRGGLRRPDTANMVLGTCLLELQRYDRAREAFRAARSNSRSRAAADRWINFIDREVARKRDIERQLARLQSTD